MIGSTSIGPGSPEATSRRGMLLAAAGTGTVGLGMALAAPREAEANAAEITVPPATDALSEFKVSVPQSAIEDLKRGLASTRWPERETVGDWSQGVPLQKAQALVAYWRDKDDWRRVEARTHAVSQHPP